VCAAYGGGKKKIVCRIFLKKRFHYGGQYFLRFVPDLNVPRQVSVAGSCKDGFELSFLKEAEK
jgi:hypothetical protein